MANTTIKISQLPNIGNNLAANTLLPVVNTAGTLITEKVSVGNIANFILSEAGNLLDEAFVATIAYSVSNSAQPNITSLGNLTALTITNLENFYLPGGNNGYVLQTDGNGNLNWTAMAGSGNGSPGGSNTQIQFNDEGLFGGESQFTYNKNTSTLNVGNINLTSNLNGDYSVFTHDVTANVVIANYLYGDGSNISNINVGAGSYISNGTSNVLVENNGNINFNVSGDSNVASVTDSQFLINIDLDVPGNANIGNVSIIDANIGNANLTNVTIISMNVSTGGNIYEDGSTLIIRTEPTHIFEIWGNDGASDYKWSFDQNGHLTLPGNTAFIRGDVDLIQFYSNTFLQSGVSVFENFEISAANNVRIFANNDSTPYLWEFDNTGNMILPGNTFAVNYANGTQVPLGGGGSTGNVTFDDVTVQGVNQLNLSAGPDFTANLAYLQVRSGDVASHIHLDTGNNEAYDLIVGNDAKFVQVSSTGNIIMSSYDGNTSYTWTLDTTGNLILAGGESVIQSVANSSLDPINPNVSTMILTPSVGYSSQSLVLDPTAPGHIHLRAPGANIDEPYANIFLGGEASSFEVGYYNGNAPNLYIHSGGNTWTFDTTGILVFPRDTSNISTDPILNIIGGANPTITSSDASLAGPANLGISALNTIFTGSSGSAIKIYPDDGEVASDGNLQIWANSGGNTEYSWTFDNTGNLSVPGNILVSGSASPAPYINGFSSITTIDGANIAGFVFDQSNITLPGNTVAINFANGSAAFGNLVQWTTAPVANTSAGSAGQAAYDSGGNLYVCVSTNTWAKFTGTTSW